MELVGNKDSFPKPALSNSQGSFSGSTPERPATPKKQRGHKRQQAQSNIAFKDLSQQSHKSSHISTNSIDKVSPQAVVAGVGLHGRQGQSGQNDIARKSFSQQSHTSSHTSTGSMDKVGLQIALLGIELDGGQGQSGQNHREPKSLSLQSHTTSRLSLGSMDMVGLPKAVEGIGLCGRPRSSRSSIAGSSIEFESDHQKPSRGTSRPGSQQSSASFTKQLGVRDTPENYFQSPSAKKQPSEQEAPVRKPGSFHKPRQSSGELLHSDNATNPEAPAPQYTSPGEPKPVGLMKSSIWGLEGPREDPKFKVELPERMKEREKKGDQGGGELNRLQQFSQGFKARASESKKFLDKKLKR